MYLRSALLVAALLALLATGEQVHGQKKGKGKKGNRFEGVITRINYGKGNEDAKITVLHDAHLGKGKDKQVGQERTFDVDLNTKVDRFDAPAKKGKKGNKDKDAIRFTSLKKGQHVIVRFRGNHAEEITLISGGGKGKGKGKDKDKKKVD